METVSKSELKRRMLELFRRVQETGEPLIVTDHRVPVLKVVPITTTETADDVFGKFRPRVVFHEDPVAPTTDEWSTT